MIASEGDWYRVEFQDPQFGRRVGYIEKRHVSVIAAPAQQAVDLSVPESKASSAATHLSSSVPFAAPAQLPTHRVAFSPALGTAGVLTGVVGFGMMMMARSGISTDGPPPGVGGPGDLSCWSKDDEAYGGLSQTLGPCRSKLRGALVLGAGATAAFLGFRKVQKVVPEYKVRRSPTQMAVGGALIGAGALLMRKAYSEADKAQQGFGYDSVDQEQDMRGVGLGVVFIMGGAVELALGAMKTSRKTSRKQVAIAPMVSKDATGAAALIQWGGRTGKR